MSSVSDDDDFMQLIVDDILSENTETQLQGLRQLGDELLDDEIIGTRLLPRLVDFLKRADLAEHQFWAARILRLIAIGTTEDRLEEIVIIYKDYKVVPELLKLLVSSSADNLKVEVLTSIGLLAECSVIFRDFVVDEGALSNIFAFLDDKSQLSMSKIAVSTLLSIVGGMAGPPPFEKTHITLPHLKELLHKEQDVDILSDACDVLSMICRASDQRSIQALIDGSICSRLVDLLFHSSPIVLEPALRIIARVVANGNYEDIISKQILLWRLFLIISSEKKYVQMEAAKAKACLTISNMVASSNPNIVVVIDAGLIPPLLSLLATTEDDCLRAEGGLAICNMVSGGTEGQIVYLVEHGSIDVLCDVISSENINLTRSCIIALESMLKVTMDSDGRNKYPNLFKSKGVATVEKFFNLPKDLDANTWERARTILRTYFGFEVYIK